MPAIRIVPMPAEISSSSSVQPPARLDRVNRTAAVAKPSRGSHDFLACIKLLCRIVFERAAAGDLPVGQRHSRGPMPENLSVSITEKTPKDSFAYRNARPEFGARAFGQSDFFR